MSPLKPLRRHPSPLTRFAVVCGAVAGLWTTLPTPARADDDHERARAAVASGRVLPLRKVLEALERQQPPGQPAPQVLEVELEEKHGLLFYEIKLLQADGRVTKVRLDARTAEPLRNRGDR
ncbi:PepSY domain-containing protein [Leptothrix sp. BB-4]